MSELVESWMNTVPRAAARLSDQIDGNKWCRCDVEDSLTDLVVTAEEISCSWMPGEVCPACGDDEVLRFVSFAELARHANGERHFADGSAGSQVFGYMCGACDTVLRVSPAGLLVPRGGIGAEDRVSDSLSTVLTQNHPSTDWTPGTECPECGNAYIGEQPVDVEYYTSAGGEFSYVGTGDRLCTVVHWCDGCGQDLGALDAGVLMEFFKM